MDAVIDPFTNYEMKPPKDAVKQSPAPEQITLTPSDLAALREMDREALISLIKRVSGAMWGIGLMSEEETYDAMLLRLAVMALTSKDARDTLTAMREWMDRKRGKPLQSIAQDIRHTGAMLHVKAGELTTAELMDRLQAVGNQALLEHGVRIIEGKVERIED